jgi:hypothetical protein
LRLNPGHRKNVRRRGRTFVCMRAVGGMGAATRDWFLERGPWRETSRSPGSRLGFGFFQICLKRILLIFNNSVKNNYQKDYDSFY